MNIYIGFDTSCYTTSVAAVNENGRVLANCRKLLPVSNGQRGLRQSEAVFLHIKQIKELSALLWEQLKIIDGCLNVCGVGASTRPRNTQDSYMPVFTVGETCACLLADSYNVQFVKTSHQMGHVNAALCKTGLETNEFLAFHLSGGTSELLHCSNDDYKIVAATKDLHAGQLVDRVGVAMGYNFPAGPALEKLAYLVYNDKLKYNNNIPLLPLSMEKNSLFFHVSGAETASQKNIECGKYSNEAIAFSVFDFLARTVVRVITKASKGLNLNDVLIAGGVASSTLLRLMVKERLNKIKYPPKVYFGIPEYSGDNAVGVALITKNSIEKGEL